MRFTPLEHRTHTFAWLPSQDRKSQIIPEFSVIVLFYLSMVKQMYFFPIN